MRSVPPAGRGFFPLDEELALRPGRYSPYLQQCVVRLGTWLPFEQVPEALAWFTRVRPGRETARRLTERAGAALVAQETARVEQLEQHWPAPVPPPALHQVSVDGAMVPLLHGVWAEVKTLAIGRVVQRSGEPHATELSYFSRLADADTFRRLAWAETHRRGVTLAPRVCAVVDGAEWCQTFLTRHCPDAVRILDFPHAAGYVSAVAQARFGPGTEAASDWLEPQLHTLKQADPQQVLAALRALPVAESLTPAAAAEKRDSAVAYLEARLPQIQYAQLRAAGYPIGSGAVESANKLVVEARLKGSGMHWARSNVNPMVALRALACSDRWAEGWAQIWAQWGADQAAERRARRGARPLAPPASTAPPAPPARALARRTVARLRLDHGTGSRPAADHPWRKRLLRPRSTKLTAAKT
jgi:hypothetical protein